MTNSQDTKQHDKTRQHMIHILHRNHEVKQNVITIDTMVENHIISTSILLRHFMRMFRFEQSLFR